jgi:hypothetical protein
MRFKEVYYTGTKTSHVFDIDKDDVLCSSYIRKANLIERKWVYYNVSSLLANFECLSTPCKKCLQILNKKLKGT